MATEGHEAVGPAYQPKLTVVQLHVHGLHPLVVRRLFRGIEHNVLATSGGREGRDCVRCE